MFKKAERTKLKGRIALDGPSGSGKSYTALRAAFALGKRVAVIDTEYGSASKYAGESPDGTPWEFDVCELKDYGPDKYCQAINAAAKSGYDVIVIDSLSHAWTGEGGALDMVDRKASEGRGNSFTAWRDVTPMHRRMIDTILACPAHIIATMRTQTEYVMEPDEKGRLVPKKIGTKPIQRAGVEYEFDVVGDIDIDHILKITKSRCSVLQDARAVKPNAEFWTPFKAWLDKGVEVKMITDDQAKAITELRSDKYTDQQFNAGLTKYFGRTQLDQLTSAQADELIARLSK